MDIPDPFTSVDTPLEDSDVLVTLDLWHVGGTLGIEDVIIAEGQIKIGRWHIWAFPPMKSSIREPVPDQVVYDLYLVQLRFELAELPGRKYYESVEFRVHLDDKDAVAYKLYPNSKNRRARAKQDEVTTLKLGPAIKFEGIELKLGEWSRQVRSPRTKTLITASGEGLSEFTWIFRGQNDKGVTPETLTTKVILEVPKGTKSVTGNIYCESNIVGKQMGLWKTKLNKTVHYALAWELAGTPQLII